MRFCFGAYFLVRVRHGTLVDLCISYVDLPLLLVDLVNSCLGIHPGYHFVHSIDNDVFYDETELSAKVHDYSST